MSCDSLAGWWWWCWDDLEKDHSVCDVVTRWSCGCSVCDLCMITVRLRGNPLKPVWFHLWSLSDHRFVLVTRWSRWYIAWPVSQVWDGSCGTWDLRWWLINILVVHIVIISCFIMVAINLINLFNAMFFLALMFLVVVSLQVHSMYWPDMSCQIAGDVVIAWLLVVVSIRAS